MGFETEDLVSEVMRLRDQRLPYRCPACNRTTLFVGEGGFITCGYIPCPNPIAASGLLPAASKPATVP